MSLDVQIVDISQVGRDWDSRRTVRVRNTQRMAQVSGCHYPFAFWPRLREAGL